MIVTWSGKLFTLRVSRCDFGICCRHRLYERLRTQEQDRMDRRRFLAVLIIGFVERFYFTLRHGLATTYKSGMQRLAAKTCYHALQITMTLNAVVLCAWITGESMPPLLERWNRYSIVIHFMLALLGVTAVRDSDAVATHRRLELKAETARQDLVTLRKATMLGNPLVLFAAKLRGFLDGVKLARELLGDRSPSESSRHADGMDHIAGCSGLYLPGES
jgi:hypothetical protein